MELDSKEDQSLDKLGDPDGPETKLKQRLAAIGSDWQRSETSEPMCRANWLRPRLGWTGVDRCLCGQWGYCQLRRSCTGGCMSHREACHAHKESWRGVRSVAVRG